MNEKQEKDILLAIEYMLEKLKLPKEDAMSVFDKIRKPVAPPTKSFKDKNKYNRKEKHKDKTKE